MNAYNPFILLLLTAAFVVSCSDKYSVEQDMHVPVYMSYETLRSSVRSNAARELVNPGKIYFKDSYIFVVEYQEGVHVINVSDPASPRNLSYIEIPGCVDIAIRNNTLYADSYVDAVMVDITNPSQAQESGRLKDIFPYILPPLENSKMPYSTIDQNKGVVVGWQIKRDRHEIESNYYIFYPDYPSKEYNLSDNHYSSGSSGGSTSGGATFGVGGSMARFGLYDRYLYMMNNNALKIYDVTSTPGIATEAVYTTYTNWGFETMFIHDDHIFFGTTNGMYVYSLENPINPVYKSVITHITSCDPVVVQDSFAYITLRGGTSCRSAVNQLDVVKLSDQYQTLQLIRSYEMEQPYGLGIDGNTLFVCDGPAGLKVYDVSRKDLLQKLAWFPDIRTYDVIPVNNYLFMTGQDGFYLYDYGDVAHIRQIGHIPVKK